jgi:L-asparagine transporter-like permease
MSSCTLRDEDPTVSDALAGYACRNRIAEWACALIILNFGLTCLVWPTTIADGAFRYILALGVTPFFFTWTNILAAVLRITALYYNGRGLPWSARCRAVGAIFGSVVFAHMAWCLAFLYKDRHSLSLFVGVCIVLAGVEVYSALRAGADVNENNKMGYGGSRRTLVARIITNDTTESQPSVRPSDPT